MSGNENVSNQQYPEPAIERGYQEGSAADFFNSYPPQQPQITPSQHTLSSMNPAFQPQGPPVFFNPMDYQKHTGITPPVTNYQDTPWQQGQHPPNGMENNGYMNQSWNSQPGEFSNHCPSDNPNQGEPHYGGEGHHNAGGQEWHGNPSHGMHNQYAESWKYNDPPVDHHGGNHQQHLSPTNLQSGHHGHQPDPLNPLRVSTSEADNESVSSGGGLSGFFHDRDEDDVDLVRPKGKESGGDRTTPMGLSGPDIIPASSQESSAEHMNPDPSVSNLPEGASGGVSENLAGSLPDVGQRTPGNADMSSQHPLDYGQGNVGELGVRTGLDLNCTPHNRNVGSSGSEQDLGGKSYRGGHHSSSSPSAGEVVLNAAELPSVGGVGDGTTQQTAETAGMPEIVKQSSFVNPNEGQGFRGRLRTQSSDLISDIEGASKGAGVEGHLQIGDEPDEFPTAPPLSPPAASGDQNRQVPVDPASEESRTDRNQSDGLVEGGVTENHPDLSATVPTNSQISKPDITNVESTDKTISSPLGHSTLTTTAMSPSSSDLATSHTSAFRSISGRHTPKQTSAVNPSPPLWSTGIPSTTGNILLAPALSQPSIMPVLHPSPVKLQRKSQPSLIQPHPMPLRATADALAPGNQQSIPVTNVSGVTQQMGSMQIAAPDALVTDLQPSQQPPTSEPTFDFGKPYQQPPPSTATAPTVSQPTFQAELGNTEDSMVGSEVPTSGTPSDPNHSQSAVNQQQPPSHPEYPGQHPGGAMYPQQYPHMYGAYSHGQGGYNSLYGGYPGGWERYGRQGYGTRYDSSGVPMPPDQYQHHQYGRQSPYRQGADRSSGWSGFNRPPSQQGQERPHSRQGWAAQQGDYPDSYNYQKWLKDREEYDTRREDYYRQWYHQRGGWPNNKWRRSEEYWWYYQRARAQQAKSWTRESDQSGEWRNQTEETDKQEEVNKTDGSSFTSDFHHAGGGTPEKFGADQSRIQDGKYIHQERWQNNSGFDAQVGGDGSYNQSFDSYSQNYSGYADTTEPTQTVSPPSPERMTPVKFGIAHVVARFSPGGHLIKVLPNTPADGMASRVEIHCVEDMLEESAEAIELKSFPGPLIRGETHKSDVIRFATRKAREAASSTTLQDRDSVALLWELMELLCRQNGSVLETDISELLLRDHFTPVEEASKGEEESSQDRIPARNIQKDTAEFRNLLLYGRKKESLEFAMKTGLWGHALLLAGKMDARTHASVMTRFANSLDMNDPLQTLYQLMSDRQPAAVTSCSDEKWGDWRPHLAMILSNLRSSDSELGIKSITALGDSLATRGLLYASHFCYLMAQVGLGPYTHKATKIVLLGSSHRLQFSEFATNMSIQLTEVYEYAQLLGNKHYLLPNFQAYKFLYATRLAEHGMLEQALRYCEVIAGSIQYKPEHYSCTLVEQICELTNRLKYHDTQYYDGIQLTEPQWLLALQDILLQMKDGTIQPPSKSDTPMPWVESYSNLSTIGGDSNEEHAPVTADGHPSYPPVDYNQGYQDQNADQYYGTNQQWGYQSYQDTSKPTEEGAEPTPTSDAGTGFTYGQDALQQQNVYPNQHWQTHQYSTEQIQQNQGNLDLAASANSNFSEYSTTTGTETAEDTTDYGESMTSQAGFDYYGHSIQRNRADTADTITGISKRQRSQSGSSTHQPRSRTVSGSSNRSEGRTKEPNKDTTRDSTKAQSGGAAGSAAGGGWFSGLFNKLRSKNGKEIHLPDDKSQTIVWDPDKKKWVNTLGGDDDDTGPQGPPPSDMELTKQQTGGPGGPGGLAPPVGMNKFSRKTSAARYVDVLNKDSSLSSAPSVSSPSSMLPPMQSHPTAPVNFYIPEAAPESKEQNNQQQVGNPDSEPPTPKSTQAAPQFFNPDSFGINTSNAPPTSSQQLPSLQHENLSHSSSMSSLSEEVSHLTSQSVKEPPQKNSSEAAIPTSVPGAPLMFNPSQMTQPSSFPAPSTNKPSRYGARRQYPTMR